MQEILSLPKKYKLPIFQVLNSLDANESIEEAILEKGILINSGEFNGLNFDEAFKAIEKKSH
jgi:leucyl-tRNA synthetase